MASCREHTEAVLESDFIEAMAQLENDDKYRFAYDIVKAVVKWSRGITLSDAGIEPHENFIFTNDHKEDILNFLEQKERRLKKLISESMKENQTWNIGEDNYLQCKRKFVEDYKAPVYSEKEFVRLCAGIVFIALGNLSIRSNPKLVSSIVQDLRSWMVEVLAPGGTLKNSTWKEN